MLAQIASGHVDLADVLFLIAAIVFVIEAVLVIADRPAFSGILTPVGLAVVAVAWLVL